MMMMTRMVMIFLMAMMVISEILMMTLRVNNVRLMMMIRSSIQGKYYVFYFGKALARKYNFNEGGGQRPSRESPEIHPFWGPQHSLFV